MPGLVSAWIDGQVNHLGIEPDTQIYSAWLIPSCVLGRQNEYSESWGSFRHIAWNTSLYALSCSVGWCL